MERVRERGKKKEIVREIYRVRDGERRDGEGERESKGEKGKEEGSEGGIQGKGDRGREREREIVKET